MTWTSDGQDWSNALAAPKSLKIKETAERPARPFRRFGHPVTKAVIGSADAYGDVPAAAQPIVESQALRPLNAYGASKAAAAVLAGQWADGMGLDVVVV